MNTVSSAPAALSFALTFVHLAAPASAQGPPLETRVFTIEHPFLRPAARFGEAVALLDFDGDGDQDVAIGAPGQSAVYVALRGNGPSLPRWDRFIVLPSPTGPGTAFGAALACGSFDDDAADELVVGDPELEGGVGGVFVFGAGDPFEIEAGQTAVAHFGASLVTGDFDGDGYDDVAIGSPRAVVDGRAAGRVDVVFDLLGGSPGRLVLENPAPVEAGAFGTQLAAADTGGDGLLDLVVSGIANTSSAGVPIAGQVYVFHGPLEADMFQLLEDPAQNPADPPRFGMHVAARGGLIAVGAPRKDIGAVVDAGAGFAFGGSAGAVTTHLHANPGTEDILGFRTALFDAWGSPQPDLAFVSLARRAVYIWDGDEPLGEPRSLRVLADSGSHFCRGIDSGQIFPGGREELVLGDPDWTHSGLAGHNVGRVVIYGL